MKFIKFIIQSTILLILLILILLGLVTLQSYYLFLIIGVSLTYYFFFGFKKPNLAQKKNGIIKNITLDLEKEEKELKDKTYNEYTNDDVMLIVSNMPVRTRKYIRIFFLVIILIIFINIVRNRISYNKYQKENIIGNSYQKIKNTYDSISLITHNQNVNYLRDELNPIVDSTNYKNYNNFLKKLDSIETFMIDSLNCDCEDIVKPNMEAYLKEKNIGLVK